MEKQALRNMLQSLRSELHAPGGMDVDTRAMLHQLHDDIEVLLDLSSEAAPEHHVQVQRGLRASIHRFEDSHPKLTGAMNHVLEVLAGLGI